MRHLRPLALILLCLLSACSKRTIKNLPPQNWQGYEVTVLSVESKGADFTSSQGLHSQAKEGSEVVVAEVDFKPVTAAPPAGMGSIVRAELEEANGTRHEIFVIGVLGKAPLQFPFEVPKGAELKTLRVGDLTFDLK